MARLPPFFALRALEAAARRRSYSRAADELAVTHGAVSQQIRRLEAELGARLFTRQGNAMIPTPDAARLAGKVREALDILTEATAAFRGAAEKEPLRVSLDPQFASRWLPPRLPRLLAHPAGANLELLVDEQRANFVTDGVDMGVRYGAGVWDGVESTRLFLDTLTPLCSPDFAARHPIAQAADLLKVPLLHHTHRPWRLWFSAVGLPPPEAQGLVFTDSVMLLEAAAQGLGVALARSGLVEQDLKSGRLVTPLPQAVASELGFHVVWRADSRKAARIHALRDWLLEEVARGAG
ncbi:MAG: transcriptional regulator GcvA [Phenylobacterium sp.]|uniref:transcriptional regulator GcvA n=1 Tax=Phenylobacterium sp. TaxID=1871053 RepID=UPI003918F019